MDAVFTNGSLAPPPASSVSAKMADLSKEAILQAITDQDLRFLAVRRLHYSTLDSTPAPAQHPKNNSSWIILKLFLSPEASRHNIQQTVVIFMKIISFLLWRHFVIWGNGNF